MHIKKITAVLTSLICCGGMLTYLPEISHKTYACELVNNSFEVNYEGWYGNADNVSLEAIEGIGTDSTRGMLVSNREKASDGVSSEKGFYLSGGVDYHYSAWLKSENSENFRMTLRWLDPETNEYGYETIAEASADGGHWTELSADFTAPKGTINLTISLNTDSTADFCFDNVVVTTGENAGTVYAASTEKGLKDEFAPYFRVGNILNGGTIQNSAITANILKDFNSIECENETKPDATLVQSQCSDSNIGISLQSASAIMEFCTKNNIAMRGHAFVWHSQTPSWFFKDNFQNGGNWVSSAVMDKRLESYIKNMFAAIEKQYPDLNLYAYDVANECISDDENRTANNGGTRVPGDNNVTGGTSSWVSVYGDNSFVEKAFTYARKYAPEGCDLYYNDYNEYWDHKRDAIYNMCKSLYQKGLLDGVGMQSHVPANAAGFAGTDSYIVAMNKYLSIGCDVQITELDISLLDADGNVAFTQQQQADKYKAIFQAAMDYNKNPKYDGRVTAVCIWGPNDANSWLKAGSDALLYDKNNQPKLAYTTLTSMIPQSQWGDGSNPSTGGEVKPIEPNKYGWYFADGFEGDLCDWEGRGAEIMTSGRTAYVGSEALLVQNRTVSWNGTAKSLSPITFVPGTEFSFSVHATYFDGDTTQPFYLKLEYTDANGETQYSTIAEATGIKGEWVQLANRNYEIPADASDMKMYVETAEGTDNFYIDEVIVAIAGTTIVGEGSQKISLADINGDGKINVFDLCLAKRGVKGGFDKKAQELAADVNQNTVTDVEDVKLLSQYLTKIITKFPIDEKPVSTVDTAKMESLFSNITVASSYKKAGENNPLFSQRFGADPGVMEYNGRIYVYTTNDVIEYDENGNVAENTYGLIDKINCVSSADMVNWTDHGAIQVAGENGVAKWANNSWAPCAAHKKINGKEKFFLYFCNGGNGVSVLTSDSPTGPWTDPLGKAMITRSTPNCSNVLWLFDPAVFVDDDGTGYLCFGGGVPEGKQANPGTARVVKLGSDMISLAGDPQVIDAPYIFEDSGINKIGNKYYYTYCSNWNTSGNSLGMTSGAIEYMVSDNPLGPYTYGGELFKNQGNFFGYYGNNHHSVCELNGQLYLFYHSRPVEGAMGIEGNYRSPQVDKITMNGDKMDPVTGTMAGIAQLKKLNPYETIQAETMNNQAGINVRKTGDTVVTDINSGDWISLAGVNFSKGAKTLTVNVASSNGGAIKICTGSAKGDVVGYVDVPSTGGSFNEITVPVNNVTGTKDLYFVFSGEIEFDSWSFAN